jgi:hypothetical protein
MGAVVNAIFKEDVQKHSWIGSARPAVAVVVEPALC